MEFVSVAIVNYNGRRYLPDCLGSLRVQDYPRHRFEVVVVDNASADESVAYLRAEHPWVQLVALRRNTGFTGGNRRALSHARGGYVVLLNNDTIVRPDWLRELVAAADSDARVGGVAAKLVFADGPPRVNSAGMELYRDGRAGDRGFREEDRGQYEQPREVFGACGASVLLKRAMLDDIGFLDRRAFMYYEDTDLAWRAQLRGWKFLYAPRAVVRHVHCATSGEGSPFFAYHVERNRARLCLKNGSPFLALWALVGLLARVGRAWLRALPGRSRRGGGWRHGWALTKAAASVLIGLPRLVAERYRIRVTAARVSDRAITRWMRPPPCDPSPLAPRLGGRGDGGEGAGLPKSKRSLRCQRR